MKKSKLQKNITYSLFALVFIFFAFSATAEGTGLMNHSPRNLVLFANIMFLLRTLAIIAVSLAFLLFLWGLLKYLTSNSADVKKTASSTIISGIVALFVMVSLWGLVTVLINTFGLNNAIPPNSNILANFFTGTQAVPYQSDFISTLKWLMEIVSRLIISIAAVYFLFGLIKYGLAKSGEEQKKAKGVIFNGLIILFVMISFWSLAIVFSRTFRFGDQVVPAPMRSGSFNTIRDLLN